jgi:hypothetical protein
MPQANVPGKSAPNKKQNRITVNAKGNFPKPLEVC